MAVPGFCLWATVHNYQLSFREVFDLFLLPTEVFDIRIQINNRLTCGNNNSVVSP